MEAEVPEKEELEIKTTITYLVKKKDLNQLKYMMKHTYDTMAKAEIAYEKEPDNEKLSETAAVAKRKYAISKRAYEDAVSPPEEEIVEEEVEEEVVVEKPEVKPTDPAKPKPSGPEGGKPSTGGNWGKPTTGGD